MGVTKEDFKRFRGWVNVVDFAWAVYPDYKIEETERGLAILGKDVSGEKIEFKELHKRNDLFLKMARLGDKEEIEPEDILEFVKEFGVLLNYHQGYKGFLPDGFRLTAEGQIEKVPKIQPVEDFIKKARLTSKILKIYNAIKDHQIDYLDKNITPDTAEYNIAGRRIPFFLIEKYLPGLGKYGSKSKKLTSFEKKELAFFLIFTIIMEQFNDEKIKLDDYINNIIAMAKKGYDHQKIKECLQINNSTNEFSLNIPSIKYNYSTRSFDITQRWSCGNLWSAIMMRFYWLLLGVKEMKVCAKCGRLFERKKGKKTIYCPICDAKNKFKRQQDFYQRKIVIYELLSKGYSVQEIKQICPRSEIDTIESYEDNTELMKNMARNNYSAREIKRKFPQVKLGIIKDIIKD